MAPGPTVRVYQSAPLVPLSPTVSAPATTRSPIPSFGWPVDPAVPHRRSALDSFSQATAVGRPSPVRTMRPSSACSVTIVPSFADSMGLRSSRPQDHVLRNQTVGSTWRVASSGPALRTDSRMQTSSGSAFA